VGETELPHFVECSGITVVPAAQEAEAGSHLSPEIQDQFGQPSKTLSQINTVLFLLSLFF
jgi:hypothetical protein